MRTWIFENYLNDEHGEFIPMQTMESEEFGRHFMIDIGFNFVCAGSLRDGSGYDKNDLKYVSEFVSENGSMEGLDVSKLFEIYRKLTWQEWQDTKDKNSEEVAEILECVENGEITYY